MATGRNSDAWKRAIELTLEIYRATVSFPDEELFGLTADMRHAAIRVTTSIAQQRFAEAETSLLELETQIIVAARLDYLQKPVARRVYRLFRAALKALTPDRTSPGTA